MRGNHIAYAAIRGGRSICEATTLHMRPLEVAALHARQPHCLCSHSRWPHCMRGNHIADAAARCGLILCEATTLPMRPLDVAALHARQPHFLCGTRSGRIACEATTLPMLHSGWPHCTPHLSLIAIVYVVIKSVRSLLMLNLLSVAVGGDKQGRTPVVTGSNVGNSEDLAFNWSKGNWIYGQEIIRKV